METITLKGLHFRAGHGFYEEEREKGNDFEVDLEITANLNDAAEKDDLNLTIDYQEVEDIVASVMDGPPVKLIETLAKRIGDRLFKAFPMAQNLKVAVRKLDPPLETKTDYSEVSMSWQR